MSEDEDVYLALMVTSDPINFEEAVQESKWRVAMNEEMHSIERNQTWDLVDLPAGAKKIGVKWIYKTELNEQGEVSKHKARLVAKGYSQCKGIDYSEVYAPVARMDIMRMIIALGLGCAERLEASPA